MSYTDVMIDLETMSSSNRAAIVAIAAVGFDPLVRPPAELLKINSFYRNVDLETSVRYGLEISASTVKWWLEQSEEARHSLVEPDPLDLRQALLDFMHWWDKFCNRKTTRLWSHATFDAPILSYAYQAVKLPQPYSYSLTRDVRTVYDLAYPWPLKVPIPDNGLKHNALADALHQALGVQQCYLKLSEGVHA